MPTEKWKAEPGKRPKTLRQVPVPMTMEQFLTVLDDIRGRVAVGDSWEGHIEYAMPGPDENGEDLPAEIQFLVRGLYRVGNLEGQGGYRTIGEFR